MNTWHYLRENKRTRMPGNIVFLDVAFEETTYAGERVHVSRSFKSAYLYCVRREGGKQTRCFGKHFDDPDHALAVLAARTQKKKPLHVYCYDVPQCVTLLGLWTYLDKGSWTLKSIVDADPPVLITVATQRGKIVFADLRNWHHRTLGELGEWYAKNLGHNLPAGWTTWADVDNKELRAVTVGVAIADMMDFVEKHDLGNFKATIAAQAMNAYRHRFGPRHHVEEYIPDPAGRTIVASYDRVIPVIHGDADTIEFERKAYYGGESDCYFVGSVYTRDSFWRKAAELQGLLKAPYIYGPVFLVDCNSLFPYCMHAALSPVKLIGSDDKCSPAHLLALCEEHICLATVGIQTDSDTYPYRDKGRVIYPRGRYNTTLCGEELFQALRRGHVCQVYRHAWYQEGQLFGDYVQYFWMLRKSYQEAGDHINADLCKLFLNSLYGKFAERRHRWEDQEGPPVDFRWGRWYVRPYGEKEVQYWRTVAGHTQKRVRRGEVHHAMPIVSACVTSYAREYMREIRKLCGPRTVLYQGVDSLLLTDAGVIRLAEKQPLAADVLGGFKRVLMAETAEIVNVNNYTIGATRKLSGCPKSAAIISKDRYSWDARPGLEGMVHKMPSRVITYSKADASFNRPYDRGIVGPDGWTRPLVIDGQREN